VKVTLAVHHTSLICVNVAVNKTAASAIFCLILITITAQVISIASQALSVNE